MEIVCKAALLVGKIRREDDKSDELELTSLLLRYGVMLGMASSNVKDRSRNRAVLLGPILSKKRRTSLYPISL